LFRIEISFAGHPSQAEFEADLLHKPLVYEGMHHHTDNLSVKLLVPKAKSNHFLLGFLKGTFLRKKFERLPVLL
jgi:hypothetical protein